MPRTITAGLLVCVVCFAVTFCGAQEPKLRATLEGHKDKVCSVAFSPNGTLLVSAGWDQMVKLWDVRTGKLDAILDYRTDWLQSVTFSPDGRMVAATATTGEQHAIVLWEVITLKPRVK